MSKLELPDSLVTAEWLYQHIDDPQLVVFDGSWHMPSTGQDAFKEWQSEHIKNARFFDFDQTVCDPDAAFPHMMPDAESRLSTSGDVAPGPPLRMPEPPDRPDEWRRYSLTLPANSAPPQLQRPCRPRRHARIPAHGHDCTRRWCMAPACSFEAT